MYCFNLYTFFGEPRGLVPSAARQYLITVTGFDACSLQPTSGASGEYAGLLVIKKYLEDQGQGDTSQWQDMTGLHWNMVPIV